MGDESKRAAGDTHNVLLEAHLSSPPQVFVSVLLLSECVEKGDEIVVTCDRANGVTCHR